MKAYRQTHVLGASATANARPEGSASIYGGWGAAGNGTIEDSATDYTYTGIKCSAKYSSRTAVCHNSFIRNAYHRPASIWHTLCV